VPRGGYGFSEIMQTGLECLGAVDLYATAEVLMLAAESLAAIGPAYVLNLSHMGILKGMVDDLALDDETAGQIRRAISGKNRHGLAAICAEAGLPPEASARFGELCTMAGPAEEVCKALLGIGLPQAAETAVYELRDVCRALGGFGPYRVGIDLSITDDTDYYNGVIFRGFLDGVAQAVLSGGRYDSLMNRLGKTGNAIGFAVYLSELELVLAEKRAYDVDTVLCYEEGTDPALLAAKAKALIAEGRSVRVQPDSKPAVSYREKICLTAGGEAK
jgi:ATP phosphoribosyltransferase regulatory subunit